MLALRLFALTLASMCVFPLATARAERVSLDLSACAEPAAAEVRSIAALELRGRLVDGRLVDGRSVDSMSAFPAEARAELHIAVICAGDRAELRSSERTDVRAVDLSTVPPPLRARLLALAIAELARVQTSPENLPRASTNASEASPDANETSTTSRQAVPAAASAEALASRSVPASQTGFRAGYLAAGLELSPLPWLGLSGALSSLLRIAGPWAWTAALSVGQARHDIDRGRLRVRSLGLRSGPALTLVRPRYLLHAGLGARITLLELVGEPSDRGATRSARFRTFVIGPAAFVGLSLALFRQLTIGVEAELAHQLREVRADVTGGRASTFSPWRAALSLLLGARW